MAAMVPVVVVVAAVAAVVAVAVAVAVFSYQTFLLVPPWKSTQVRITKLTTHSAPRESSSTSH